MTQLILPNQIDPVTVASELEHRVNDGIITTRYSATFQADRGEGTGQAIEVDDSDVVELEMEDGQRLWVRVDELQKEFGLSLDRSAADDPDGSIRIPTGLPLDGRTRGLGKWIIKGLKVLGVDIAGSIGDFIVSKVEGELSPGPGLYQCTEVSSNALQTVTAIDKSKPVLLFLHGTGSSIDGSFGQLWQNGTQTMSDLLSHYEDQVLAFQHQTLSKSPIENALDLMTALTELQSTVHGDHPLRLHLVSHSRGGLVGEILCRGTKDTGPSIDDVDINFFADDVYARDKSALLKLCTLLDATDMQIDRFIRVACPARGTTLADGRLDRYLSGLVNIMGKVPGLNQNPVYDSISSLLLAVVHKRTEPEEVPGLEAMMPTSPTIRMLNRPDITLNADLHVIGGDVKASGFINRLKVIITDLFYREDHDLVVNTPSMFGGATRAKGIRYWVDTGGKVNHFRYFGNSATASRIATGLIQDDSAFHTLDVKPYEVSEDSYRKRTMEPQPILFVLPGIMGSHLAVDGDRVWLNFLALARGGVARLNIDRKAPQVKPVKPLDDAYGDLMAHLAASHDVRPFAYDWRISLDITAELLREKLESALSEAEETKQPIRILAHSMGGLVVRALLATTQGKALWKRISELPGSRFVMLGTPNGGSHSMAAMLIGRDSLMRKLALLDFRNSYADLLQTIAQFDGALQLLPHSGSLDLYSPETWKRLYTHDVPDKRGIFSSKVASKKSAGISWQIPDATRLKNAASMRDEIANSPLDSERTIYVAGVAPATAIDVILDENAEAGRRVQVLATAKGDGSVPWSSGIPKELPPRNVYYLDALHGDLAKTTEVFPAIQQLLEQGTTRLLSNTPVGSRGDSDETFIMPAPEPDMYPDHADLVAAALGGSRKKPRLPANKCKVQIVHGDLARSRFPVAVGHYLGDTIVSAENYLDRQVNGRLRERHRLGMYPGGRNTSIVLLNWPDAVERDRRQNPVHPGAIVVGLGQVGDLTPGGLTNTLVEGLMRYALEVRDTTIERLRQKQIETPTSINAPLTSLLISASNDLNVGDSLRSILRAVAIVNQRLNPPSGDDGEAVEKPDDLSVRISELDIVEYWEDRALQAARALGGLSNTKEFSEEFDFHRQLVAGRDGRRRASFDDDAGWWQRMRISTLDNGDLKFETLTERARVETQLQSTQRLLVDRFLTRASASNYDASLGKTLFELVMPNQLKQYAPDRRDLVLMLDERSSEYPWELLQDGSDESSRPLAVESSVIRQLISEKYRSQPRMSQALTALVVGNPVAESLNANAFPDLPGAASEARQVTSQLNAAAYDTLSLVGKQAKPLDVVTALYDKPYRIVHIAAHGVFELPVDDKGNPVQNHKSHPAHDEREHKSVTGVVLGNGIYLTPSEFEQMRNVPEFVFINCCHLGKQAESGQSQTVEYHRLAANVATQLIRMGVRAVIAAGWAVDDNAAKLFAKTFYERFLAGESFGDSVAVARSESYDYERRRSSNTWGAYQCYGDPDFSLQRLHSPGRSRQKENPLSPAELKQNLADIARDASYADSEKKKEITHQLDQLIKVIPESWYESGSVCSAVGKAQAEVGNLKQAAHYYQLANASEQADASLDTLEQLVNMKARFAFQIAGSGEATSADRQQASLELEEAERIIDSLIKLNGSQERYSIKGGVHKRLAMLGSRAAQRTQLAKMAEAYGSAYELGKKNARTNVFYPLQNSLAARITLLWCTGVKELPDRKQINTDLVQLENIQEGMDLRDADFWTACQEPDRLLLKALSNNQILSQDELPPIKKGYKNALQRGSTARELKTICEHLDFFHAVANTQIRKSEVRDKLCEELIKLKSYLKTVNHD